MNRLNALTPSIQFGNGQLKAPIEPPTLTVEIETSSPSSSINNLLDSVTKTINQEREHPTAVGPVTRMRGVMRQAFSDASKAGGWTHFMSWLALSHPGTSDTVSATMPHVVTQMQAHPNLAAAAIGGVATVAVGLFSWATGVMFSHGKDRVDVKTLETENGSLMAKRR